MNDEYFVIKISPKSSKHPQFLICQHVVTMSNGVETVLSDTVVEHLEEQFRSREVPHYEALRWNFGEIGMMLSGTITPHPHLSTKAPPEDDKSGSS